jgi:hypothetical protein
MHALTLTASDMIRIAGATVILVFQQIGRRRGFIWLGDGGDTLDFDRAGSAAEFVERFGAAHEVSLSYDAGQLPGRAPKLWSADIVADDVRGRVAASISENHVSNMAVFQHRGTGLATVFLGLAPRTAPQNTPQASWDRLLLVHEGRRLCGAPVGAAVRMIPPWLCGGSPKPHA